MVRDPEQFIFGFHFQFELGLTMEFDNLCFEVPCHYET